MEAKDGDRPTLPEAFSNSHDGVSIIRRKMRGAKVKVATIVERCVAKDKNRDGVIHVDDLLDVFNEVITTSEYRISNREVLRLSSLLSNGRNNGFIEYEKLFNILEPVRQNGSSMSNERWYDDDINEETNTNKWAFSPGSVGEWLKKAACPAEVANFKSFISCLERFERDTGMKISMKEDGNFTVPLGPDLLATINFQIK